MIFRFAEHKDLPRVSELLAAVDLPYQDIDGHISNFLLAEEGGELIGVGGIEIVSNTALLRSLAVKEAARNNGIGKTFVDKIRSFAQLNNVEKLFLLTTTASGFFKKTGFEEIDRTRVPSEIKNTEEFKSICPSSAICMMQDIGGRVKFCTKDILRLQEDVPGAKMWGISLEKTMFTYFEVQQNSVFDSHSHESEQITMVLEGVLYFDVEGKVYPVKSGDVIAIPSNIIHSVFTRESSVKAVDAWSPIMNKYKN
ncbi:MAG: arsenic resistance N-acetyltransferase ArsN2 [Thermodesulfovibrionia bacterium]|nr:arsenic resistance N-acetyltransferase ArsN2 [Thermodesulfovibrionia bacterium]